MPDVRIPTVPHGLTSGIATSLARVDLWTWRYSMSPASRVGYHQYAGQEREIVLGAEYEILHDNPKVS